MMKNFFCIIFAVSFSLNLSAQDKKDPLLLNTININGQYLTTDVLDNFYVIDQNNLYRYDADGRLLYTHSTLNDGNFTSVDVTDPLKILLFSRDFGHIRYLDNTLSANGDVISLTDFGFVNASLACNSYESGVWIYDPVSIQLVRFNNNFQASQFSGNIAQLAGFEISPGFLVENNNMVYLSDTAKGILVFDRYGAFLKTLPYKHVLSLQVSGDKLFLFSGNEIIAYDNKTSQEYRLPVPVKGAVSASLAHGRLYVLSAGKVCIYQVE
jgi:hypothetical protein